MMLISGIVLGCIDLLILEGFLILQFVLGRKKFGLVNVNMKNEWSMIGTMIAQYEF